MLDFEAIALLRRNAKRDRETAADQIEHLSREARGAMVVNALRTCPDLGCDEAVVRHLHALGMTVGQIDRELASLIDEARAQRGPLQ